MVYRVVATKLTEEEHTKLLDLCNKDGCTPSAFIKNSILEKMAPKQDEVKVGGIKKPSEVISEKKPSLGDLLRKMNHV